MTENEDICPFCAISSTGNCLLENDYAVVELDSFPVTEGHSLIIPKRHFADYFDISKEEREALSDILLTRRNQLLAGDPWIEGFNLGINSGQIAGQTVMHCHIHLIPRRKSDIGSIKGGFRTVIPNNLIRAKKTTSEGDGKFLELL